MYYAESLNLIEQNQLDKAPIKILDREIAHAYAPNSAGRVEVAWLQHKTKIPQGDLIRLLNQYEEKAVVTKRNEVECVCGNKYDSIDDACMDCGEDASEATETGNVFYIVDAQPRKPAFDPERQPTQPTVFISYRRNDSEKLATDIYYSLKAEGYSVFLDNGEIPIGGDAELVFVRAASHAPYFISLVSPTYFGSPYCKKEIAHSARSGNRIIRVNIEPVPNSPNDMPWVDNPNWLREKGEGNGLSPELDEALRNAIKIPRGENIVDLREQACLFLLNQKTRQEIIRLWNQLRMHKDFGEVPASTPTAINYILQESTGIRLNELCSAVAPN